MPPTNPYHYGTPVEGEHFVGRQDELDALLSRVRNGVNVVLLSPRRYGKTSLIRAAEARLRRDRPAAAVVDVNVLKATSLSGLVGLVTAGAYRLPAARWHRARHAIPEFLRRLRISPVVTVDPSGTPRFGFDTSITPLDAASVLSDVYGLLEEEAEHRSAALVLDEFQAITRHEPSLPDLFKGLADEHPRVSLVLAGSKRHLMEEMVIARQAPLFGMAQRISLGPIDPQVMCSYLEERAQAGRRTFDDDAVAHLLELAGPVPNDIQHLAFEAFEVAGARIDIEAVESGLDRAVAHDSALFADKFSRLSSGQARVITAIALETPEEPFSARFARQVGLASGSSVRKALQPLVAEEDVVERGGRLYLADPFFAEWLRNAPA